MTDADHSCPLPDAFVRFAGSAPFFSGWSNQLPEENRPGRSGTTVVEEFLTLRYLAALTEVVQYQYKEAVIGDIPGMARLRTEAGESHTYWEHRIRAYLTGAHNPYGALPRRVLFIAEHYGEVAGFIAGHLTQRFGFQGELQWINVGEPFRNMGMASKLLDELAGWFKKVNAARVCVNVAPENKPAQAFYRKHGAVDLEPYWLCWENISSITENRNGGGSD